MKNLIVVLSLSALAFSVSGSLSASIPETKVDIATVQEARKDFSLEVIEITPAPDFVIAASPVFMPAVKIVPQLVCVSIPYAIETELQHVPPLLMKTGTLSSGFRHNAFKPPLAYQGSKYKKPLYRYS